MQYLCNKHGLEKFYPKAPAKRAMIDSAMFYLIGTLYPYVARATYPALGFPQYAGEVGHSDADAGARRRQPQRRRSTRSPSRSRSSTNSTWTASRSSAATKPSIADIRLAATLEFLAVIDYRAARLGEDLYGGHGEDARQGLCRARRRRARLYRLCEVAEEVGGIEPAARATGPLHPKRSSPGFHCRRAVRRQRLRRAAVPPGPPMLFGFQTILALGAAVAAVQDDLDRAEHVGRANSSLGRGGAVGDAPIPVAQGCAAGGGSSLPCLQHGELGLGARRGRQLFAEFYLRRCSSSICLRLSSPPEPE